MKKWIVLLARLQLEYESGWCRTSTCNIQSHPFLKSLFHQKYQWWFWYPLLSIHISSCRNSLTYAVTSWKAVSYKRCRVTDNSLFNLTLPRKAVLLDLFQFNAHLVVMLFHEVVDDAADDPHPQADRLQYRRVPQARVPPRRLVLLVVAATRPQCGRVTVSFVHSWLSVPSLCLDERTNRI